MRDMDYSKLIDDLGGTTAVARMFGVTPPSVTEWRTKGIPIARRQTLALLFPGKVPQSWMPLK